MIRASAVNSWQNRWSVPVVDLPPVAASSGVAAIGAGDPGSSRLVYAMVIGLVLVGIGLILLAVWILRQTRPDLDVLAPLERMGDGDWKKRDPSTQRRMLDDVRPEGADPLESEPRPPPIDADFEQAVPAMTSFSDLGPGVEDALRDPTPIHTDSDFDIDNTQRDATPVHAEAEFGDDDDNDDEASDVVADDEAADGVAGDDDDAADGDPDDGDPDDGEPDSDADGGDTDGDVDAVSQDALSDPHG